MAEKAPTKQQVGQARLDHIAARGRMAARTYARKRSPQQKRDIKLYRDTFGHSPSTGKELKPTPRGTIMEK